MARALMLFMGVINLAFLVWVLVDPFEIVNFVGLSPSHDDARTEVRAMYGGLIGGLGMVNLLGVIFPRRLNAAVWATAWAFAGVGSVRSLSCFIYETGGWQAIFASSEVAASITCFWLLSRLPAEHFNQTRDHLD